MINANKNTGGFTLLETLIALAILGFISASVWSSLFSIASTRDKVSVRDDFQQEVRIVLDRLSNDLRLAFNVPQARGRTGFIGEESKLKFSSFSHQLIDPDSKECDETMVSYSLDRDEKNPALFVLKRKENKRLNEDLSEDEGKAVELLGGIVSLKFGYYDGEKFTERWSHESIETKQRDKIPRAVKISLEVKDERGASNSYYTMVNIPLSRIEPTYFNPPSIAAPTTGTQGGTTPQISPSPNPSTGSQGGNEG